MKDTIARLDTLQSIDRYNEMLYETGKLAGYNYLLREYACSKICKQPEYSKGIPK